MTDKPINDIDALEAQFNVMLEETRTLDYPVTESQILRLFSENEKVNIPAIIQGQELQGNDILIDPAFAKANGLKIGNSIKIYDDSYKVSGYMALPDFIYPLKSETDLFNDPKSFGVGVISKQDFAGINKGSTSYAIKFNDDSNLEEKASEFKKFLKDEGIVILKWTNTTDNVRVTYVTAKIDGIKVVSSSMPIFILFLTCILTGIVLWRMLKRELISIGTLYSLGYRRKEIVRHYISFPIVIALIGGVIGTVLGSILLSPMLSFMVSYFNIPIESMVFDAKYLLISILLPLAFLMVSGYFVVRRALKNSPVDLMRGGKEKGKVNFIERNLKLDRLKFTTKFKIREMLRSIPRSAFLLLGVILATMLLLIGFVMKSSLDYMVNQAYEDAYKYKYQYSLNSIEQGNPESGEAFSVFPFQLKTEDKKVFGIYGINPGSQYISLNDSSGNKLTPDKVILTKPLADKLKIGAGDTLTAVSRLDSNEYSFTIEAVADTYVGEYIYMPLPEFNKMLGLPEGSYTGIWSGEKLDIPEERLLSTNTIADFEQAFNAMMAPMQSYIGVIAFLAFVIGLIVIYVVTSLIVEENKESISLMKVIGYRKKEVYSLILDSSSILVIIGYILGIPLILTSITAMINSITAEMNMVFPIRIEYFYIVIGFVVIYLTYEISKALSKKKVNRISMVEALKANME